MKHNHYSVTKVEDLTVLWEISLYLIILSAIRLERKSTRIRRDGYWFFITMKVKDRSNGNLTISHGLGQFLKPFHTVEILSFCIARENLLDEVRKFSNT